MSYLPVCSPQTHNYLLSSPWGTLIQGLLINDSWNSCLARYSVTTPIPTPNCLTQGSYCLCSMFTEWVYPCTELTHSLFAQIFLFDSFIRNSFISLAKGNLVTNGRSLGLTNRTWTHWAWLFLSIQELVPVTQSILLYDTFWKAIFNAFCFLQSKI